MIVRRLITQMGYRVDRGSEKKVEGSISRLKGLAGALGAVFVGGAIARGIRQMVESGSTAAETLNVINESFGEQSRVVTEWARVQSKALGRSEFGLRKYASTLGAMLRPMTGSAEAAAEMSTTLSQLAVDLGSFFEAADSDVLRALQSGLVGQPEPLRRFGVSLTVASLDAFALAEGLTKTTREMTEAEKVTLRYRFIMSQTTQAQGDAVRTAKEFANQSKALRAVLSDLQTELGLRLLPVATSFVQALRVLALLVRGPVLNAFSRIARVAGALATKTNAIIASVLALGVAFKLLGAKAIAAWLIATAPALLMIALLGIIGLAIFAVIEDLEAMGDGGRSVIGGLISEFQRWLDETDTLTEAIGEVLLTAFDFWGKQFASLFGDTVAAEILRIVETIQDFARFLTQGQLGALLGEQFGEFALDVSRAAGDLTGGIVGRQGVARANPSTVAAMAQTGQVSNAQNIEVNVTTEPGMDAGQVGQAAGQSAGRAVNAANRQLSQRLAVGGGS